MNNRYRELANEASDWCQEHAKGTPTAWEWEEKFAELIVRECSAAIMENSDRYRKEYFADLVLKHFELKR
jgi:hypothetical protein